jgi:hypothetical protein
MLAPVTGEENQKSALSFALAYFKFVGDRDKSLIRQFSAPGFPLKLKLPDSDITTCFSWKYLETFVIHH